MSYADNMHDESEVPARDAEGMDFRVLNQELFAERERIVLEGRAVIDANYDVLPAQGLKLILPIQEKFRNVERAIIEANTGLVKQYVSQFTKLATKEQVEDYVSAGMTALAQALASFDGSKGNFAHWAYQAIRREVLLTVNKVEHPGLSSRDFDKRGTVKAAEEKLKQAAGGKPVSIGEIAVEAHVSEEQAMRILEDRSTESLDTPFGYEIVEGQNSGLYDEQATDPEIVANAWQEQVDRVLRVVHPRDRASFLLREGMGGHPGASYEDIGEVLDLSRETVRKANGRVRDALRAEGLDESLPLD